MTATSTSLPAFSRFIGQSDVSGLSSVFIWSGVLLGLIILAFWGYSLFKRWMKEPEASVSAGFSLSDLRELHREGKLTDAEYEKARGKMVASAKRVTEGMPEVFPKGKKTPIERPPGGSGE